MANNKHKYPVPKFFFRVQFRNGLDVSFKEVSGLDVEAEVVEYRTGASKSLTTMKRIGLVKTSNIVMKKGVVEGDSDLINLFQNAFYENNNNDSTHTSMELLIELLNADKEPVFVWKVDSAIPVKFSGGDYNSESNEISIEEIEFAHEGIRVFS